MNQQILKILIQETNKAMSKNEVPIGCVITRNSEIISKAHNQKISRKDPTAHAEIIAIKKACRKVGSWNLNDCELYVTLKPCNMCIAVINEARIKKVYYVVENNKNAAKTYLNENEDVYNELLNKVEEMKQMFANIAYSFYTTGCKDCRAK